MCDPLHIFQNLTLFETEQSRSSIDHDFASKKIIARCSSSMSSSSMSPPARVPAPSIRKWQSLLPLPNLFRTCLLPTLILCVAAAAGISRTNSEQVTSCSLLVFRNTDMLQKDTIAERGAGGGHLKSKTEDKGQQRVVDTACRKPFSPTRYLPSSCRAQTSAQTSA
jgi:hypothetical protein